MTLLVEIPHFAAVPVSYITFQVRMGDFIPSCRHAQRGVREVVGWLVQVHMILKNILNLFFNLIKNIAFCEGGM